MSIKTWWKNLFHKTPTKEEIKKKEYFENMCEFCKELHTVGHNIMRTTELNDEAFSAMAYAATVSGKQSQRTLFREYWNIRYSAPCATLKFILDECRKWKAAIEDNKATAAAVDGKDKKRITKPSTLKDLPINEAVLGDVISDLTLLCARESAKEDKAKKMFDKYEWTLEFVPVMRKYMNLSTHDVNECLDAFTKYVLKKSDNVITEMRSSYKDVLGAIARSLS